MRASVARSVRLSVGVGGANNPADVRIVQELLNRAAPPSRQKLAVDGIFGPKTRAALVDY